MDWKTHLAHELDVDPLPIYIVGSACLGFSLSPRKRFVEFHSDSDIDVAIVSSRHFEEAWQKLRSLGPVDLLSPETRTADFLNWHRGNLVFDGTIATDKILDMLPFGPAWTRAFGLASTRKPTLGRDIRGRIYKDCQSLRAYQENNVRRLRASLLVGDE
ncbi:hypothetical protein ACIA2T_38570 [Amycolatopsis japonica]|uniref:hypothetical protein n=1 Tax=Amycolatopsis japonica TaxID=208439 RepID=UPI00379FC263